MASPQELVPKRGEGLTELQWALLDTFKVEGVMVTNVVNLSTQFASLNPNDKLTMTSLIQSLIDRGYLESLEDHKPHSLTWKLKRIK
jgi:hypothetical protein